MSQKKGEIKNPWTTIFAGLFILFITSAVVAYFVPNINNHNRIIFSSNKSLLLGQFIVLLSISFLTVIYLAYFRTKFHFSNNWLIAAVTYNVLIIYVKYTLSISEYSNKHMVSFNSILYNAILVSCLYIFGFFILYLVFDGKVLSKSLHKSIILTRDGKFILAMSLFLLITLARIIFFRLPIISGTTSASYLGDIFKAKTALLSALIFIIIIATVEAYAQVRRRSDLKYFFVSGVSLVVIFHITWAIYIYRGIG